MTNVTPISAALSARRPAPTAHELEASLEAYFYREVRLRGGMVDKVAPTRKGMPDRLVLLPGGRIFLVELKAYDGRVSAAQALYHERAAVLGTRVQLLVGRGGVDAWLGKVDAALDGPRRAARPRPRPQQ